MFSELHLHVYGQLLTSGTWNVDESKWRDILLVSSVANPGSETFLHMQSMY